MDNYHCPICAAELEKIERYPKYVCRTCADKVTDINGRKISFSNPHISGGFIAHYSDNSEIYESHSCYIDGIACHAEEAKFGGIVIQKL